MVKVFASSDRNKSSKFSKATERSKSKTVSKRNLSNKELKKVKDKKRSEKEIKNEKKKELLKKQRKKEKEERHKRFLPGVYNNNDNDKKENLHSEGNHNS